MKQYAIGIDVGGTTVKIGLFRTEGELLKKWEIRTRTEQEGRFILPDAAASVRKSLENEGISLSEVEGVGIGVPGAVLESGVVNRCVNLGWGVVDVAAEFSGLLDGLPVQVGNDANVAALGEMWKGGGQGFQNMVMVTLGTGVGGGVILNERIVHGAFGAAGEIGHICMSDTETECCGCGKRGCLEQYASASGIARMAEKKLLEDDRPTSLRELEKVTAKDIFAAAKAGDILAMELVEDLGSMLGKALSFISCVVDPQAFVIGGGVSGAGSILTDTIQKYYRKSAFHASEETKFVLATLGNDAGIYGAVRQVLGQGGST
ncbi:ROK family protein [Lachnospiraceae bacterium OF09-33XD]|nr:ROK family protein [Lachnospiraceae bacterium OF09-33XD]